MQRSIGADDLSEIGLFRSLDENRRESLAAIANLEQAPAGTLLFREGEPADDLRVIVDGRVALSIDVPGRGETVIATLSKGELLGWSALLPDRQWVAAARTLKPTTLLVIEGERLSELCESDHELGFQVMRNAFRVIADRLRDTRVQLLDMFGARD